MHAHILPPNQKASLLMLFLLPTEAEIDVVISHTTVTLICNSEASTFLWKKDGKKVSGSDDTQNQLEIANYQGSKDDGTYTCESSMDKSPLYLKAKVCENCEELDILPVASIIIADLLITLGVLILVYYCGKSRKGRAGAGAGAGGRPRGQKMQRPPPIPNPDYEVTAFVPFEVPCSPWGREGVTGSRARHLPCQGRSMRSPGAAHPCVQTAWGVMASGHFHNAHDQPTSVLFLQPIRKGQREVYAGLESRGF
uniref:CD3 epsilon subunit of T-cell receptor complex n=1 Tax=Crocodylus porosus TaxID=8502 RepID=A0A7M4DUW0_CROPO